MLNNPVLVLNRLYQPVNITNVRRALCLLYLGAARALGRDYQTFDFQAWLESCAHDHDEFVGAVSGRVRVPRVLVLEGYDRLPKTQIRFSRHNVYQRDAHTCQYCARQLPRRELNLDHVMPRSRGGKTGWENVVTSCLRCNATKGGRTPEEAGMLLLRPPRRPRWVEVLHSPRVTPRYEDWVPFLEGSLA